MNPRYDFAGQDALITGAGLRHGPGDGQSPFQGILCATPFKNRSSVVVQEILE
jgi:hypothetical protein